MLEGGVILERNVRALYTCSNCKMFRPKKGLLQLQSEQVYHVRYAQELVPLLPQQDVVTNLYQICMVYIYVLIVLACPCLRR